MPATRTMSPNVATVRGKRNGAGTNRAFACESHRTAQRLPHSMHSRSPRQRSLKAESRTRTRAGLAERSAPRTGTGASSLAASSACDGRRAREGGPPASHRMGHDLARLADPDLEPPPRHSAITSPPNGSTVTRALTAPQFPTARAHARNAPRSGAARRVGVGNRTGGQQRLLEGVRRRHIGHRAPLRTAKATEIRPRSTASPRNLAGLLQRDHAGFAQDDTSAASPPARGRATRRRYRRPRRARLTGRRDGRLKSQHGALNSACCQDADRVVARARGHARAPRIAGCGKR